MAQLSLAAFYAKWVPLLADNVFQDIDGPRLAELLADMRDSFASATLGQAPTVDLYDPARVYAIGELARYMPAGQAEVFGYARQAGLLPPPTGSTTAAWRAIPPPAAAVALAQQLTLTQVQTVDVAIVAGRRYGILGKWNGSASDQLVFLDGLDGAFRQRGTLLLGDGSQQEVTADVLAGTYQAVVASAAVNPFLGLTTLPGNRFAELPVLPGFDVAGEVLDTNAGNVFYQLDLNTRSGTRVFGTPGVTLAQLRPMLQALTPSQYAAGVKLYVQTVAVSPPDDSTIYLDTLLDRALVLMPATRSSFPTDPGAPVSLTLNGNFNDPFTNNELTGWVVSGGWYWDNLALCAIAPAGANAGQNGLFLYQKVTGLTNSAPHYASILVADLPDGTPVSGNLFVNLAGQTLRVGPSPCVAGRYFIPFTSNDTFTYVTMHPNGGAFTGAIKECNVFRT